MTQVGQKTRPLLLFGDEINKSQKPDEEEQEEEKKRNSSSSRWTQLPDDCMEQIMGRLCLEDYLGLQRVCTPWRAIVANAIADKRNPPLPEPPLVLLQTRQNTTLFRLSARGVLRPKRPWFEQAANRFICHGTIEGWMIMCDYGVCVDPIRTSMTVLFFNPVTNARVPVPSPLNFPSNSPLEPSKLYITKMLASSEPDGDCAGCVLVALFTDFCHIAFWRGYSKKPWTIIKAEEGHHLMDGEIVDGKLYVRTNHRPSNCILVYDLLGKISDDNNDPPPKPTVLAMLPPLTPPPASNTDGNQTHMRGNAISFLIKDDDALEELLLVHVYSDSVYETGRVGYLNMITEYISPPQITSVKVFKLCLSDESTSDHQFVEVNCLGDRALFLSVRSVVMSSKDVSSNGELIAANSIYFAFKYPCPEDPWKGFQLGVYSLADGKIKHYPFEKSGEHETPPHPTWFVPSLP